MAENATTIDSLQIEIKSSSTDAAKGIDDLSAALGRLKKNGSFKTVSNNLNNLSGALRNLPNVHSASNSLRTLANSIEKLKGIGSVSSLTNSLTKLPAALNSLSNINLEKVAPQIKAIAAAVAPLSSVKGGGFGTMVNSLKNLGKVTDSLSDEKIAQFASKVELLSQKLEPLSAKMATIKSGFQSINSGARSAAGGVDKLGDQINISTLNMANMITTIQGVVAALQPLIQLLVKTIGDAMEWDGIQYQFGNSFGEQADLYYEKITQITDALSINKQAFMENSAMAASMLVGFGVDKADAREMGVGYTELAYDIWAAFNNVYKTLDGADGAMAAVRSAISGEVEPIRRAGFTIVESTLEQTAANHGLQISIETATEAQKSYLRYLTLVDQAQRKGVIGTYAREMQTAEGLMRTFTQQLKTLGQAFGSLFLPILVKVMPYLQAFVELLTEAVQRLASIFGIEIQDIGDTWNDYTEGSSTAIENTNGITDALDGATESAKALKNAAIGIDELNVISPTAASSDSAGGGAGGGVGGGGFSDLDVDSLWDESIFQNLKGQIDEIKEKIKDWLPLIEAIGLGIAAWSLLSLISSAGEAMVALSQLEGKIGLLKKGLAGLAILTIEAVLVFMLADEYLESGNLMALLGEALVTAAGGYLMYKGFGTKGLVMSLAVSVAAQLVAITMNLADGGVEISDPQLWIQSAFTTALAGTAGGILAYKGLINVSTGKGIGLGLLAGLSLTLTAITIGDIMANGEVTTASIFTGLGSVLAAAGFGFMVGGPWGAAIGAAVGLTINILGAVAGVISKDAEKSLKEDLESRFGKITLDQESMEVYVDKITAIPRVVEIGDQKVSVTAALDIYVSEADVLNNLKDHVYGTLEKLDALNIKIAVGVDVTKEDYLSQIDTFVQSAQDYLEQHYLTTSIAINILDSNSSGSLSSVLSNFYATNSGKLAELGAQLKDAVSDAFADGEWIPNKLQKAIELQKEIQEILDYVSNVEYRAKMENIKLSVSGDVLTADSFKDVLANAQKAIEGRLNALEEVKMSNLQVAIMQYDANIAEGMSEAEAKKIYKSTVADIEKAYQEGRVEVTYGTVDFGLETLKESFSKEIARAKSEGWFDYDLSVNSIVDNPGLIVDIVDEGNGAIYKGIDDLMANIRYHFEFKTAQLSKETRKNLEGLLKAMAPTMSDYEELASASRKAGETVPEEIRAGLNDYNELAALSGDVDAINYLVGQGFSTDTTFLNTLATAKNAGKRIDTSVAEGLLNNLTYVTDEATGLVTGIKNSVTGEVVAVTPTLKENMSQMGVELSTGLLTGAESEMQSSKKKWHEWAIWPWNWFKEKNEINSPSKLFERGGQYITEGLSNGIDTGSLKERLSTLWSDAKTWWDENKGSLAAYTPSIGSIKDKLSAAWTTAKDWWDKSKAALSNTPTIGSIKDKLSSAWTSAKDWWNKNRSSLSYTPTIGSIKTKLSSAWTSAKDWWNKNRSSLSYTPTIGSIKTKLSSAWTSAKDWWNKSRTSLSYTPSIGSIKDKLSSAWTTAKNWWNNNVKLSIPSLSFKVTYSNSGLNMAQKAIIKALDLSGWPKLSFAANGGIFDQGSLVWAGERGPEVMATAAGGRTGVMNVQQMQDAVYEGVYAAVVAAMSGQRGGGAQEVNVYLDGKQITAAVEKRQRERGATLMGNEVYAY